MIKEWLLDFKFGKFDKDNLRYTVYPTYRFVFEVTLCSGETLEVAENSTFGAMHYRPSGSNSVGHRTEQDGIQWYLSALAKADAIRWYGVVYPMSSIKSITHTNTIFVENLVETRPAAAIDNQA